MINNTSESLAREFISAIGANDKVHVLRLLSGDCAWLVVPWGETFKGHDEVAAFLGVANSTITHQREKGQRVEINGWFMDRENMCVEITNIASLSFFKKVKAAQPICLVLHMKDGKFDRVHEYFRAPFPVSLIIRMVPFITRMKMRNQKRPQQ
jgi:hypothetical protein